MSATVARTAFSDCPCCMPRRGFLAAAVMAGATSFAATAAEAQAPSGQAPAASPQPAAGGGGSGGAHRRLPRPLHDRAEGASRLAQAPDRRLEGPVADAVAGVLEDLRRPAPRERRGRAAQAPARARHERHDLLAAGRRHGAPHRRPPTTSREWTTLCNDIIHRLTQLYPKNFVGVCQLPQSPGVSPANCRRRARALRQGARLRRLQPQPGPVRRLLDRPAAHRPLLVSALREDGRARRAGDDPCQRLVQPQLPRHRRALHQRRHHRLHAVHHTATCSSDFPTLQLHHPARRRRGALPLGPLPRPGAGPEAALPCPSCCDNVFFDTCVYHQAGIDLLTKVIPVDNILFASEMVGAVRGIDPETGRHFDDTKRYIDAAPNLSEADRRKIFEGNARRVYPRLAGKLGN